MDAAKVPMVNIIKNVASVALVLVAFGIFSSEIQMTNSVPSNPSPGHV
jgi:hypothetical protein